jgi:Family of unknown function (DUF5681)
MAIIKKSASSKALNDNSEVGYGKPPKTKQFKKGTSGNPSGRPKKDKIFKSMDRILRDSLLREIEVSVNGKSRKMLMMEAIVAKQEQMALQGNTQAAKFVILLGEKHIPQNLSIAELMEGRQPFEGGPELFARFDKAMLLADRAAEEEGVDLGDGGDGLDEEPIL